MPKAIFFDRDGVLNVDRGQYTYRLEDFHIMPGVKQVLTTLKRLGFRLIVVTNQAGISKGIYGYAEMNACHAYLQEQTVTTSTTSTMRRTTPIFQNLLVVSPEACFLKRQSPDLNLILV